MCVTGPMMLLEMCEEPLKDWLSARQSLTTDDLEAILGFSLNVARGVEHLHSLKVCMQPYSTCAFTSRLDVDAITFYEHLSLSLVFDC